MTSPTLKRLYASGGTEVLLYLVELASSAWSDTVRIAHGYDNPTVTTEDGRTVTFTGAGIQLALPKKDASGNQDVRFAIDNVTAEAQKLIEDAIAAGAKITLTLRTYISTDLTAPADLPFVATVKAAQFDTGKVQVDAGFFDLINMAWPRDLYTLPFAPGLAYMQ